LNPNGGEDRWTKDPRGHHASLSIINPIPSQPRTLKSAILTLEDSAAAP
jgi:hypothetical protein